MGRATAEQTDDSSRKAKIAVLLSVAALLAIVALFFLDSDGPRRAKKPADATPTSQAPSGVAVAPNLPAPGAVPSHYPLIKDEEHAKAVEAKLSPLALRFSDKEGPPCEIAYDGFSAYLEADVTKHNTTFVLPERAEFLKRCTTKLTPQEQQCLNGSYQAAHRDICEPIYKGLSEKVFDRAPGDPVH